MMKINKGCLIIFMVLVGILLCGQSTQAEEVINSGIRYRLDEEDNICAVTGYDAFSVPAKVSIPETITENGQVYKVIGIGYYAFFECEKIESVSLPKSIERIDHSAFKDCKNLKSISIEEGLKYIDTYAFYGCSSLGKVYIPSTVHLIDCTAFQLCDSLTEIKVDEKNEDYYDLEGVLFCNSSSPTLDGGDYIDTRDLTCYPGGKIGDIFEIERDMICGGADSPFMNNKYLKSIVVDSDNEWYSSFDGVLYDKNQTVLEACPAGKTGTVSILDSVDTISWSAFYGSHASEIIIPDSVTFACGDAFVGCSNLEKLTIGKGYEYSNKVRQDPLDFSSYKNLDSITVSPENQTLTVIAGVLYDKAGTTIITCPKSVRTIDISSNVQKIYEDAFVNSANLDTVTVSPENEHYKENDGILYNKGETAILLCPKSVTEVTISSKVDWVYENAFENCSESLVLTVEEDSYILEYAESKGLKYKIKEKEVNETKEDNTQNGDKNTTSAENAKLGDVKVISNGKYKITGIAANAQTVAYVGTGNKNVSNLKVPDVVNIDGITYKVTTIAPNALANNKKLTKVTVGKNVTAIGKNAFKNCKKLKSVTLKSTSLNTIGSSAFQGDKNLKTITIKSSKLTAKSIGKNAFKGTNKNLVIKVPKKKAASYKKILKKKGNTKVKVKKG